MNAATLSGPPHEEPAPWRVGIALAALGVVYGDIGTSPLYAFKETLASAKGLGGQAPVVLGLLSLIFWTLALVVTLKYVLLILRADHDGEGGTLSLQALARHAVGGQRAPRRWLQAITAAGLLGAAMFYGDSVITPAISVLSAIDGLNVATPLFAPYVLPITAAVLVALFAVQRLGTHVVGRAFGPVMIAWFATLGVLGLQQVAQAPQVLQALDPTWAAGFLLAHPGMALAVLGSVFLAVTGGEALYADMGHFGARAIRQAWFFVALPGLVLNYFGQGALVLRDPAAADNPFFRMVPAWGVVPMVVLAAIATVIASQAVISGAYSITAQAVRMGYLPRLRIVQTSGDAAGQVYMPAVNWLLMLGVLALVLGFGSSGALSAAYGLSVSMTMVTTTFLACIVAVQLWRWPAWAVLAAGGALLGIDLVFVVANGLKIDDGGWLPILIAGVVLFVFTTWSRGRALTQEAERAQRIPLQDLVDPLEASPPHRVRGTAVFLTADADAAPHALLHNLKHNQVLHERIVVLQVLGTDAPRVGPAERLVVRQVGRSFWQVTARHGFMEKPDVPEFMKLLSYQAGIPTETMVTSYFTSRETVGRERLGMNRLRHAVYAWLHRNAGRPSDYFCLPGERVVELGRRALGARGGRPH